LICNVFKIPRGLRETFPNTGGLHVEFDKAQGLAQKIAIISWARIYFQKGNPID
jgi:hypothetical protein